MSGFVDQFWSLTWWFNTVVMPIGLIFAQIAVSKYAQVSRIWVESWVAPVTDFVVFAFTAMWPFACLLPTTN